MSQLFTWFITSSANPQKTSLAVIGFLTFTSGYILQAIQLACLIGLTCLPIDGTTLSEIINAIGYVVELAMTTIGAVLVVAGLMRKAWHGRWTAAQ